MRRHLGNIIGMAASVIISLTSCGKDVAEVIPRKNMAKIYAEMLLTDQWIMNKPGVRLIADTSLVYAPILEKYGYDAADYRMSVDHYMDDPERFAKILRETGEILDARLKDLGIKKQEALRIKKMKLQAEQYRPDTKWEEIFAGPEVSSRIALADSLVLEADSTGRYNLVYVERADTVYEGVVMIIDTLTVAAEDDTVSVMDTVVLKDTVVSKEKKDTIIRRHIRGKLLKDLR